MTRLVFSGVDRLMFLREVPYSTLEVLGTLVVQVIVAEVVVILVAVILEKVTELEPGVEVGEGIGVAELGGGRAGA